MKKLSKMTFLLQNQGKFDIFHTIQPYRGDSVMPITDDHHVAMVGGCRSNLAVTVGHKLKFDTQPPSALEVRTWYWFCHLRPLWHLMLYISYKIGCKQFIACKSLTVFYFITYANFIWHWPIAKRKNNHYVWSPPTGHHTLCMNSKMDVQQKCARPK